MKIIDRYLLRSFWTTLIYLALACYCLLLVLKLFESFGDLLENHTPLLRAAQYLWYAMPYKLLEVLPMALMLAVLFSVGMLARNQEILAISTSGTSVFRISMPLILSALLISLSMIALNETVVYAYQERATQLRRLWIDGDAEEDKSDDSIVVRGEGARIYVIGSYERKERLMRRARIYDRDPLTGRIVSLLAAESAQHLGRDPFSGKSLWELRDAVRREFDAQGNVSSYVELGDAPSTGTGAASDGVTSRVQLIELEAPLVQILSLERKPEEMNARELHQFILDREAMRKPTAEYRAQFYLRLFFPFSCLVMILIGIPFALKAQEGRTMVAGFGQGILCAVAYYALIALLSALSEQELFPPWAPAAIPIAVFSLLGLYFIRRSSYSR